MKQSAQVLGVHTPEFFADEKFGFSSMTFNEVYPGKVFKTPLLPSKKKKSYISQINPCFASREATHGYPMKFPHYDIRSGDYLVADLSRNKYDHDIYLAKIDLEIERKRRVADQFKKSKILRWSGDEDLAGNVTFKILPRKEKYYQIRK